MRIDTSVVLAYDFTKGQSYVDVFSFRGSRNQWCMQKALIMRYSFFCCTWYILLLYHLAFICAGRKSDMHLYHPSKHLPRSAYVWEGGRGWGPSTGVFGSTQHIPWTEITKKSLFDAIRKRPLGSKVITRLLLCACSLVVVGGGSDQSTIHEKQLTNVICYMRLTKRQLHLRFVS